MNVGYFIYAIVLIHEISGRGFFHHLSLHIYLGKEENRKWFAFFKIRACC